MGLRILVPVKHVIDPESLEFRESEGGIKFERMYHRINECDRYAVQEAVRLKEQYGGEVVIVTVGLEDADETIHMALGMERLLGMRCSELRRLRVALG